MSPPLRFLALVAATALAALAAATTAADSASSAPMHLTIDISAARGAEVALPSNLAIRAGGTVTLTFRNHTNLFHTFTIRALGISTLIRPANGHVPRVTSVTFVAPYGVYAWTCVLCASGAHAHMHAMRGKVYAIINT